MANEEIINVTRYDLKYNTYQLQNISNLKYTKERKKCITISIGDVILKMIQDSKIT